VPDSTKFIADIRPRLQSAEKASIAEFKRIAVPMNVGESALAARRQIACQDLRSAILRLAHISPITSFERIKRIVAESASVAPLSFLAAGVTKDAEGRTVGLKPPLSLGENEQYDAIFAHVVAPMSIERQFNVQGVIIPAFDQLCSEHVITLQEMEELYRLRLIDSEDFGDSRAESKQLACVVMIRSEGHDHDDHRGTSEQQ